MRRLAIPLHIIEIGKMSKIALFLIDPQNSFCEKLDDQSQENCQKLKTGELYVPGADESMKRLAAFVEKYSKLLKSIKTTLDSHNRFHIGNNIFFVDDNGNNPPIFTRLEESNNTIVGSTFNPKEGKFEAIGNFRTYKLPHQKRAVQYLKHIDATGRYKHTTWPVHCQIGTRGHNVHSELMKAFVKWEDVNKTNVNYVTKGSNPFTEHFSAVQAEVIDPNDPTTQFNNQLADSLIEFDKILIGGQARSHCVANTIRDIANNYGEQFVKKCVLLTDATNDVPGFEHEGEAFVKDMSNLGMETSSTTDFFA